MKRIMWFFALIPVAVTSIVLQFMPDIIPMHHDLAGNTDRWGSKMESFIFPVIIMFITLFWYLLIRVYEKKAVNAEVEKEQLEAKSAAKVLSIVGLSQAVMFGIMHYFILYSSYVQASTGGSKSSIDIAKVSCILLYYARQGMSHDRPGIYLHSPPHQKRPPPGGSLFLVPIRPLLFSLSLREVHFSGCEDVHAR